MIAWIKAYAAHHIFYLILIAAGLFFYHTWLSEHDARLLADQTVKVSEQEVKDLQAEVVTVQAAAAQKTQVIIRQVGAIKTPVQAIAAIPDLSALPLNSRQAVDRPDQVSVDAVPLAKELGQCRVDAVNLQACQATSALKDQQLSAKDVEITALKKKPSFWHRFLSGAKKVGAGLVIGLILKTAL